MTDLGPNRRTRVGRESSANRKNRVTNGYRRNGSNSKAESSLLDEETCLICADRIIYSALSPCNHITCHKCTFRQRAKYQKKQCLICRSENDKVIFTDYINNINNDVEFDGFTAKDFKKFDAKHGIEFTSIQCYEDTMNLLKFICRSCDEEFESFKDLSEHEKSQHNQYFCLICAKSKMVFVSELDRYNFRQLQRHQSEGDKLGFSGHPECKYCRGKRFYSDDELVIHVRERHERCFICDQDNPKTADYYRNYDSLYEHFRLDHYVCSVPICIEKKFVVFRDDIDLTAHMLKEHGGLKPGAKVVVGSNRQFHSQLSTFVEKKKAKPEDPQDSPEIKKLRLDERARHYLNYNTDSFNEFQSANSKFKNKSLSANDLVLEYERIFKQQSKNEIHLLVYDFSELFPKSTELFKSLVPLVEDLAASLTKKFPVLGGQTPTNSQTVSVHSWGNGGRSSTPLANMENNFPALTKPKRPTHAIQSVQPIRYTTVVSKANGKLTKPKVNSGLASPDYKPNYLNSSNNSSSATSLALKTRNSPSSSVKANLDTNKFPVLEQRKPKKFVAPPIKPVVIADPNQWGSSPATPIEPELEGYGIPIVDKRKLKAKKKQDKQIFRL
ncbi:uncharacterized protein KQ657_005084 [Scheffersomyces spartinae]|uniref:RING-type E3 ubiquitin transferase n=1 Tax=Scheffersomyces spartinae TaxID=45513 RepID=A0A9P7V9I1_9ASCO|nr:uncharacterized protein KQ657_005084 [Scheffersomyces spartinae]KAG7193886.1 hypothetical protein KQ657_005084 [Scheffersomyces spartinae]